MVLLAHPTGNANVRQAAQALEDAGLLAAFWTSIAWNADSWIASLLPARVRAELNRRAFPQVPGRKLRTAPWRELGRLFCGLTGMAPLLRGGGPFSIPAVYAGLDQTAARSLRELKGVRAVYAYDRAALRLLEAASRAKLRRLYELPTPYWRFTAERLREELELHPEWARTMPDPRAEVLLQPQRQRELELADLVIAPSRFVRRTLRQGGFQGAVRVVPYGAPPLSQPAVRKAHAKLRVLYVGALSQCKGLAYLFEAVRRLDRAVELALIGRGNTRCPALARALRTCAWTPSLPHPHVLQQMRVHDVLVLPTLWDGFGLVILEAMSQGSPVITTPNSGAEDIIESGKDGFIVPIRSPEAIAEKLELLHGDRDLLAAMGAAARAKAARFSWEQYRSRLAGCIRQCLAGGATASALALAGRA